jgi:hypothetical protein
VRNTESWPHWDELPHKLIKQRCDSLGKSIVERFRERRSIASNVNERLEIHERMARELLAGTDEIYRQAAIDLKHEVSPAFLATVWKKGIRPVIARIAREMKRQCWLNAPSPNDLALRVVLKGWVHASVRGLRFYWEHGVDSESEEAKHACKISDLRSSLDPLGARTEDTQPDFWRRLRGDFDALHLQEFDQSRVSGRHGCLTINALFDANHDGGYVLVGFSGGEDLEVRFRALAAEAGHALRPASGYDPASWWFRSLYVYLLAQNRNELLLAATSGEVGIVQQVSKASATFCAYLTGRAHGTGSKKPKKDAEATGSADRSSIGSPVKEVSSQKELGHLDIGRTIYILYEELKRLRATFRGRRKTELQLRSECPELRLWQEIDDSRSLPMLERNRFFEAGLDSRRQVQLMRFVGWIVGYEGDTAYKLWKKYRKHAGLQRKRTPSSPHSASRS